MLRKTVLYAFVWFAACQAWAAGFPEDRANNWHRWRGPEATGVAPSGNPPITWDEDTNIKWKVALPGSGSGSPVVWGDKIFLLTTAQVALLRRHPLPMVKTCTSRLVPGGFIPTTSTETFVGKKISAKCKPATVLAKAHRPRCMATR